MSKLHKSRQKTITKPLNKKEVGYLFEGKLASLIINDLKKKKYGSYLIGGIVGTGKTSQVEIASNIALTNPLIIHIHFFDQVQCVERFENIVLEELIKEIKRTELNKKSEKLQEKIKTAERHLYYDITESIMKNINEEINTNVSKIEENEKGVDSGVGYDNFLKISLFSRFKQSKIYTNSKQNGKKQTDSTEYTKIQPTLLSIIYNVIDEIKNNEIVFIYDEIDKMSEDVINDLFARYKELFVEKDVYSYFIVNESIYRKYNNTDLCKNPVYSYFMEKYYVPLLDFKQTLRYITMMFDEKEYVKGLAIYYMTLGNYRLINQRYLSSTNYSELDVVKAYIFMRTNEQLSLNYFDDYMVDMLKVKIKSAIESMVFAKRFDMDEFDKKMQQEFGDKDIWPNYINIINTILSVIESLYPDSVEKQGNTVEIKWDYLLNNYLSICNQINEVRNNIKRGEEIYNIQAADMYKLWEYKFQKEKKITFLSRDILPLNVSINEPESYKEILTNIVYSNLDNDKIQAIVLKQLRGEKSYYAGDYEYSGIVVICKADFQIAYYVERGSYLSDREDAICQFVDDMKTMHVNVQILEATEEIKIDKDILDIVNRFNNPYSKCYEDRKVRYSNLKELKLTSE